MLLLLHPNTVWRDYPSFVFLMGIAEINVVPNCLVQQIEAKMFLYHHRIFVNLLK